MNSILSKIKYQYKDFLFNLRIFPLATVVSYYYRSYLIKRKFVDVNIKKKELGNIAIKIRCRNGIDKNVLYYSFFCNYHLTKSIHLNKANPVILDLGSNIGCTIIDIKLKYPGAIVYGYEMDIENYELAISNCSNFTNVHLFNKAVWINNDTITYNNNDHADAYSINTLSTEGSVVACQTIENILDENKIERVDFLKMDIEGAEVSILNELNLSWLDKICSFNIEFHNIDEEELGYYFRILTDKGFNVWKSILHWSAIEGIKQKF